MPSDFKEGRRSASPGACVLPLVFCSGLCALVYQMAWMRDFRLIFGTSTSATAAVTAIFMGGLGAGALWLGGRVDRAKSPLRFYGMLELLVALTAGLTPILINLVGRLYILLGGTLALGMIPGTVLRLILAAVAIGVPAFLMGGSLPAAVRAVTGSCDSGRRRTALLYGINTLGAVGGVAVTTFYLFEKLGTIRTFGAALLLNLGLALGALILARRAGAEPEETPVSTDMDSSGDSPVWFTLMASGLVGFAFFLLEIVWYRLLSPLMGGSTFTFGVILAVALLGIGLGAATYGLRSAGRQATLGVFALTCTAEALCVIFPFALGDRIAIFAAIQQPMGIFGFGGQIFVWMAIAAIVVGPTSFVAGIQFPMIISLLGQGKRSVGRQTGHAYAWNTVGAILGSLAGGFGLLPLLTATRVWQLAALLLAVLGLAAVILAVIQTRRTTVAILPVATAGLAIMLMFSLGPTAVWRHTPIGAGRVDLTEYKTRNQLRNWVNAARRAIIWQADGVESSVGVANDDGVSFLVNGKSDGNARSDAPTQVMCGMIGAILHPHPKRALVIGLGTGSSAGWLAAIPSIERVDVAELEPSILHVAAMCSPVNHQALENPKLLVHIGDARELMLTSREKYDLIASEPSNPYRAGVASLFTKEFYEAAASRLNPGGSFSQWVQAYEVDTETIKTIYTTMVSVFPHVETWQTQVGDLLFVASSAPAQWEADALRARIKEEPFRSALAKVWRVDSLEGMLAHFVANSSIASQMADSSGAVLNTDDRTVLEYAFARDAGRNKGFDSAGLGRIARERDRHRPDALHGEVDWTASDLQRISAITLLGEAPATRPDYTDEEKERADIHRAWVMDQLKEAEELWFSKPRQPANLVELTMVAQLLAYSKDDKALGYIESLRKEFPADADAIVGLLRWRQGRATEAAVALESAFLGWRTDPWGMPKLMEHALDAAVGIAESVDDDELIGGLLHALDTPFAVSVLDERRKLARVSLAEAMTGADGPELMAEAFSRFEPNPIWNVEFLRNRATVYSATSSSRAPAAEADLDQFLEGASMPNTRPRPKGQPRPGILALRADSQE